MIFALLMMGCASKPTPQPTQTPPAQIPPESQTYLNGTYGFKFTHPSNFVFVTPTYANLEDKIVQLQIDSKMYPKTNFGDANLAVSAVYAKSPDDCLAMNPPEGATGFKVKTLIKGFDFHKAKSSGAAAGNLYEATVYRGFFGNQTCIELTEMIHTMNLANYQPGAVTEVDKKDVQKKLDDMLQSFEFTS